MKLHGLNLLGVPMTPEGLDLEALEEAVNSNCIKASYLIPSYHNPTGIVMPYEKERRL